MIERSWGFKSLRPHREHVAKVKAKFSFKPKSGITVKKSKSIALKQS